MMVSIQLIIYLVTLLSIFRCQCGHCNVPSSPLNSPVSMLPPFKPATSHTKGCAHNSAQNSLGQAQWSSPVNVPNFNPHLLISNDLHGIPPSQLLPPPLMMNGLGNPCHGPSCSSTTGYREGVKSTEQVYLDFYASRQCLLLIVKWFLGVAKRGNRVKTVIMLAGSLSSVSELLHILKVNKRKVQSNE